MTSRRSRAAGVASMRSATNMILVAMAQSDLLTGIWPLPGYLYFFVLQARQPRRVVHGLG